MAALNRGDIEASVALQAADAQVLAPRRPAEASSPAIRASLENLLNLNSEVEVWDTAPN